MRPSSIARRWRGRPASPRQSLARSRPKSPTPATARWGSNWKSSSGCRRWSTAASDDLRAAAHAFALLDVATALAKLAVDDNYVRPEVDGSLGFAIEGGRHPVVEQALKRDGQPFIANACDLSPATRTNLGADLADHRPEHGRQIDLPAPERADRAAGADRQLCAGDARADRHRRPAVLARRRGRRSGARALHLHGGDGGNRRDPQPGQRALAGDSGRDRPRHRDLRRPVDRVGGDRASA